MMKADLHILILAAALGAPATSLAAPGLDRPELTLRHHPRAALPTQRAMVPGTFEIEGRLERGVDGELVLALPLREATRLRFARAQGRHLAEIPRFIRRSFPVAPGELAEASVALRVGKTVRAVLSRDRSGRTFVVDLLSPRR